MLKRRAVASVGLIFILAACSSTSAREAPATDSPPPPATSATCTDCTSPAAPTITAVSPDTPAPIPLRTSLQGGFVLVSSEGIRIRATIWLHPPTDTVTAANTWSIEGGKGTLPCVTDPQTDAVMIGTLEFENLTPTYTPDFYVNFNGIGGGTLALGAGYGDGNVCASDSDGSVIKPDWADADWGPVPITIVIHHDIGPSNPMGDPTKLQAIQLYADTQSSDDYALDGESGIIQQLNGSVMLLHLDRLRS